VRGEEKSRFRFLFPSLFFLLVLLFLLLSSLSPLGMVVGERGNEQGNQTKITVEVVPQAPGQVPQEPPPVVIPPPPGPPPPGEGRTGLDLVVVPGPQGPSAPTIAVDCYGWATSPTTGVVEGQVDQPADCLLHFGESPDLLDRRFGPTPTAEGSNSVRWDVDGLTPDTEYWFRVEGHSKVHQGLVGWSPVRSFRTPPVPEDGVAGLVVVPPKPKKNVAPVVLTVSLPLFTFFLLLLAWKFLTTYVVMPEEGIVWFRAGVFPGVGVLTISADGIPHATAPPPSTLPLTPNATPSPAEGGTPTPSPSAPPESEGPDFFELGKWLPTGVPLCCGFSPTLKWPADVGTMTELGISAPPWEGEEGVVPADRPGFLVCFSQEPLRPLRAMVEGGVVVPRGARVLKLRRKWGFVLRSLFPKRGGAGNGGRSRSPYYWVFVPIAEK